MKIKKIAWSNYKQYKEADEIDISDLSGTIGILGNNGSGKSTLLKIIPLALFGIRGAKERKDFLRTHGVEKEPVLLRLEFSHDNKDFIIDREYRGVNLTPQAKFWQIVDEYPTLLASDGDVDSFVKKVIGLDAEAFLSTIFCQQKELEKLSELDPAERKKLILKLAGVNKVDEEIKLTREKIRDSQKMVMILQDDITNKESIQVSLEELDKLVKKLKSDFAKAKKESEKAESEQTIIANEKADLEKKYKTFNALSLDLTKGKSILESLRREEAQYVTQLDEIKKLQDYMESTGNKIISDYDSVKNEVHTMEGSRVAFTQKEQFESQLKKLIELKENLLKQRAKLQEDLNSLNFDKSYGDTLINEFNTLDKEINKLTEDKIELTSVYKSLNSKIDENNKELLSIKELVSSHTSDNCTCPTCKQTISEKHVGLLKNHYLEANAKLVAERDDILTKGKATASKINELKEKQATCRSNEQKYNALKQKYNELTLMFNNAGTQLEEKEKDILSVNQKIEAIGDVTFNKDEYVKKSALLKQLEIQVKPLYVNLDKISKIDAVQQTIDNTRVKISNTEAAVTKVQDDLTNLDFNVKHYEKISSKFNDSIAKVKRYQNEVNSAQIELNSKDVGERKIIEERLNEIQRKEKEYQKHSQLISDYAVCEEVLLTSKLDLMKNINPLINRHFSDIFRTIIDGKYEDIILDDNYDIKISEDGILYPLEKYSGGEQAISNLALRLAISKFLTEINNGKVEFVVLDEIFASLDDERKSSLIEVLSSLDRFFNQIFIISHEDTIKSSLDNYISVKENGFGYSEVSIEEQKIMS